MFFQQKTIEWYSCSVSCLMLDFNYSRAAELGFDEAMGNPSMVGGGENSIPCPARDFDPSVYSIVTEVCKIHHTLRKISCNRLQKRFAETVCEN